MMDACHPSCCAFHISAGFAVCVASEPTIRHRIVGDCHLWRCHCRQSQPPSVLILSVLLLLLVRIVQRTSAMTVEPMAMRILGAQSRRTQRCQGPHRESVQVHANRRALECDRDIPTRPCKSPRRPHTSMLTTLALPRSRLVIGQTPPWHGARAHGHLARNFEALCAA